MNFLNHKLTKAVIVLLGIILATLIGVVDYLTGQEFSVAIFYLIPIALVTWLVGRWAGALVCLPSAIDWYIADRLGNLPVHHPLIPYWNAVVELGFFLTVTFTLSAWKSAYGRERELAQKDHLTQTVNGRYFEVLAQGEIQRARRYQHPFTLAYLDLDDFKEVNDRFGHYTGDTLLRVVAAAMMGSVRKTDVVARLGGDEFVILLPETDYEQAGVVLRKLQQNLTEVMQKDHWPISASIGAATFVRPPDSVNVLIQAADALMFSAKQEGKNRVRHEAFGSIESLPKGASQGKA